LEHPLLKSKTAAPEASSDRRYFHSSREPLKIGITLAPRTNGYVNWPEVRETEKLIEHFRPPNCLPRQDSVFMADSPELCHRCGGDGDYVYEVEPIGEVQQSGFGYYSKIEEVVWDNAEDPLLKDLAQGHWSGQPYPGDPRLEYRCREARIVRLVPTSKTAAPIHEEAKDRWFYHGCSKQDQADGILSTGIQPREVVMRGNAKDKSFLAPAKGRVYVTPSFEFAAIHALGGDMFGHVWYSKYNVGPNKDKNPYGYIFGMLGDDLQGDVVPDEDVVGQVLGDLYSYREALNSLKNLSPGHPDYARLKPIYDREIEEGEQKPINQPDAADVRSVLVWAAENFLTNRQKQNITSYQVAHQSAIGKKLQPKLNQAAVRWFLDNGAHVAHLGAIHPRKAWRFKKVDAEKIKRAEILSICEEIPVPEMKIAALDWSGWAAAAEIRRGDTLAMPGTLLQVRDIRREGDEIVVMGKPGQFRRFSPDDQVNLIRKVAGTIPAKLYHTSPSKNRKSIERKGLLVRQPRDAGRGNPPGVYGVANPDDLYDDTVPNPVLFDPMSPEASRSGVWPTTSYQDIWEFDTDGLTIRRDEASGMEGSYYSQDDVPPAKLRLYRPGKQWLKEKVATDTVALPTKLYHGTSMWGIVGILKSDSLDEGVHWNRPNEPHGPRLTKSYNVAKGFAIDGLGGDEGAIIEFNAAVLKKCYKLVEYRDVDCTGEHWKEDEEEITVVTDRITPVRQFVTAIHLRNPFQDEAHLQQYAEMCEQEERMPAKEFIRRYKQLLKNQLVRPMGVETKVAASYNTAMGQKLHQAEDGEVVGTLGQFLVHPALRKLFEKVLDVSIKIRFGAHDAAGHSLMGSFGYEGGEPFIYVDPTSGDEIRTIYHEAGHALYQAENGSGSPYYEERFADETMEKAFALVSGKQAALAEPLYHVTFLNRLSDIAEEGLVPGSRRSIGAPALDGHAAGKVFLTTASGVDFWLSRAEMFAYNDADGPVREGYIPIVLRVQVPTKGLILDDVGTDDASAEAFYTSSLIAPGQIEYWDGTRWSKLQGLIIDPEEYEAIYQKYGGGAEDGYLNPNSPLNHPNLTAAVETKIAAAKQATFNRATGAYFSSNFAPALRQQIIKDFARVHISDNCGFDSEQWCKYLLAKGVPDVTLVEGYFHESGFTRSIGHWWVMVNDAIFDPTGQQFGRNIDEDCYDLESTEQELSGTRLLKRLFPGVKEEDYPVALAEWKMVYLGDEAKKASGKKAMKITVPESEFDHFWVEPPPGHEEFWALRWPVKAKVGDPIVFHMNKKPVAEAVISRIEKPGESECERTHRFKHLWKVYFNNFKDIR
jgi:hypothetical protein